MVELVTIQDWLRAVYNDSISLYVRDDHVRFTNGSAAHYIDIYPRGDTLELTGERYGERISEECAATEDALLSTMSQVA